MTDLAIWLPAAAAVFAGSAGAYISGRLGRRNGEAVERRARRRALADAAIESIESLRSAFHESDPTWTGQRWERAVGDAYHALDAAAPMLPAGLRHLRRSLQDACGEALGGVAIHHLVPRRGAVEPPLISTRWSQNARDYHDVIAASLRQWREAPERHSLTISAPTYDEWLRGEGRYE